MERFIDFQPTVDSSEAELALIGQPEGGISPTTDETADRPTAEVTTIDAPDPFGALKVWLGPNHLGAEVFRHENNHGR